MPLQHRQHLIDNHWAGGHDAISFLKCDLIAVVQYDLWAHREKFQAFPLEEASERLICRRWHMQPPPSKAHVEVVSPKGEMNRGIFRGRT